MKDTRALSQLKCWLRTVGISFRKGTDADLLVTNAQGQGVPVCVVVKGSAVLPGAMVVNGADITGRDLRTALDTFAALQVSLGFEAKMPVDRGPIPQHKLSNGEDFDLAAFRHTELRRVPNPDRAAFERYKPVILRCVWRFWRQNEQLCHDNMVHIDDLKTFAQVWLISFVELSEKRAPEGETDEERGSRENENNRLLYTFLGQRFHEHRERLVWKGRNVFPMLDDAFIGQRDRTYNYLDPSCWDGEEVLPEEEDSLIDRRQREWRRGADFEIDPTVDVEERRKTATTLLDKLLGERGHDEMVELLKAAIANDRISPDARAEAERRHRKHVAECQTCSGDAAKPQVGRKRLPTGRTAYAAPPPPAGVSTVRPFVDEQGNVFQTPGQAARFWGGIHRQHVRAVLGGTMGQAQGHTFRYVEA